MFMATTKKSMKWEYNKCRDFTSALL
uniref:Uncharacterized protein n=1 Tax=Anguilla anguilla TaxID=7936 RepID=A0A0E9PQC6_ANGAN